MLARAWRLWVWVLHAGHWAGTKACPMAHNTVLILHVATNKEKRSDQKKSCSSRRVLAVAVVLQPRWR